MSKSIFILIVSLLLVACNSAPKKVEYNPQSLPREKLASVVPIGRYEMEGYLFSTAISSVYDEHGVQIAKTYETFSGYASEVTLPEGKYLVQVMCTLGVPMTSYNYHTLEVSVKPKEKYDVYCLGKMGKGLFGIKVPDGMLAFISNSNDYDRDRVVNQDRVNALPLRKD